MEAPIPHGVFSTSNGGMISNTIDVVTTGTRRGSTAQSVKHAGKGSPQLTRPKRASYLRTLQGHSNWWSSRGLFCIHCRPHTLRKLDLHNPRRFHTGESESDGESERQRDRHKTRDSDSHKESDTQTQTQTQTLVESARVSVRVFVCVCVCVCMCVRVYVYVCVEVEVV
jgi:hypothetical protein